MSISVGKGLSPKGINTMWDQADLKIGNFCSVAGDVLFILGGNHRSDWFTTHTFEKSYNSPNPKGHPSTKGDIVVGHDVWIGQEAIILSGVKIGSGAVIGAYSVVSSNIPPYALAAGNPAQVRKYRFSDEIIGRLLKLNRWDWKDEKIKRNMSILCSELTLEKLEQLEKEA